MAELEWRQSREEARRAAMRLRVDDSSRWRLLRAKSAPPPRVASRGPVWRHLAVERRLCASVEAPRKEDEIEAFIVESQQPCQAVAPSQQMSCLSKSPSHDASWRGDVRSLYRHLTTQSTASFRPPAVEASPGVVEEPEPALPPEPPGMARSRRGSVMSTATTAAPPGRRASRQRKASMARSSMSSLVEDCEYQGNRGRRRSNAADDVF